MSRSKHTDPPRVRAPRRVRALEQPRGHEDASARQALGRALKELGLCLDLRTEPSGTEEPAPLPRVRVARPREGYHHPATRADMERLLRFFGAPCTYGLQSIELVRADDAAPGPDLRFGRLVVPGRILLYEQPRPPWVLPGRLPDRDAERLRLAGALLEGEGFQTLVTWPGEALREFMLFEGLMHEIGHHMLQQYRGKRPARVVRTSEHEAFACRFAAWCREIYSAVVPLQP